MALSIAVTLAGCSPVASPPVAAEPSAVQLPRVPRIGFLTSSPPDSLVAQGGYQQLLQGLRDYGYLEGETILIEYRSSDGHPERFPALAAELINLSVDAIVVGDARAVSDTLEATTTIPVITPSGDIWGARYVSSLSRPGGNLTGLTNVATGLSGKRLELLLEAVPGASRVAVLRNAALPSGEPLWSESQAAARALGIQLVPLEIYSAADISTAFERAKAEAADALIVLPDPLANTNAREISGWPINHAFPPCMECVHSWKSAG